MHSQQKAEAEASATRDGSTSPNDTIDHEISHGDDSDEEQHHWVGAEPATNDKSEDDLALDHVDRLHEPEYELKKKPASTASKHFDLDDFANSPAADADDTTGDDEDVEMRVTLG